MLSRRPYLIRALYEWLVDSGEVPHLLVDATLPGVAVPAAFVKEGRIVLNVGVDAVQGLRMAGDEISFSARFQGQPQVVRFPPEAVIAIYGRESGQGMMFGPEEDGPEPTPPTGSDSDPGTGKAGKSGRPSLKVIK